MYEGDSIVVCRNCQLSGRAGDCYTSPKTDRSESRGSGAELMPFSRAACRELTSVNLAVAVFVQCNNNEPLVRGDMPKTQGLDSSQV